MAVQYIEKRFWCPLCWTVMRSVCHWTYGKLLSKKKQMICSWWQNLHFIVLVGRQEPMGTSAATNQEKKDFREPQLQPAKAQKPVSQSLSTFPPSSKQQFTNELWYSIMLCLPSMHVCSDLPQEGQWIAFLDYWLMHAYMQHKIHYQLLFFERALECVFFIRQLSAWNCWIISHYFFFFLNN